MTYNARSCKHVGYLQNTPSIAVRRGVGYGRGGGVEEMFCGGPCIYCSRGVKGFGVVRVNPRLTPASKLPPHRTSSLGPPVLAGDPEESMSQGLKPSLSAGRNVRAEARTYLRGKSGFPAGMTNERG